MRRLLMVLSVVWMSIQVQAAQASFVLGPEYARPGVPRVTQYDFQFGPSGGWMSFTLDQVANHTMFWIGFGAPDGWAGPVGPPTDAGLYALQIHAPGAYLTSSLMALIDAGQNGVWLVGPSTELLGVPSKTVTGNTVTYSFSLPVTVGGLAFQPEQDRWDAVYMEEGQTVYSGVVPTTIVPEPSTFVLGAIGALGLVLRRWRSPG